MNNSVDVPIIDISPLSGNDSNAKLNIAARINKACREEGFFYASGHDIDLQQLEASTLKFHRTITESEKWRLAIKAYNPKNKHFRNGFYLAIEGKKAPHSFCYLNPSFTEAHPMIRANTPMHEVNLWPSETMHPGFQNYYENYFHEMFRLTSTVLKGFALSLGKDEHFFDAYFKKDNTLSAVSLIRYPYLENYPPVKLGSDGTTLSFERHKDVSLITVLYQSPVPNLQVKTPNGYKDLPTSADCFLINCGTYMDHVTNGYYHAPIHRVKYINKERLSIPFFANLGHDSMISPFNPNDHTSPKENEPLSYGQYLKQGLMGLIKSNGQT